jgi:hypothetical protein
MLAVSALFSVGFTALRCFLMLTAYDAENGFYTDDALHAIFRYPLIASQHFVSLQSLLHCGGIRIIIYLWAYYKK